MNRGNAIEKVNATGDYRLRVGFRDGFIGEINLAPLLETSRGPLTQALQEPSLFAKAYVDAGAVAWPNGYDIDPDVMRYYCEIGRVCSREELAAAFAEAASPMRLNDEPLS